MTINEQFTAITTSRIDVEDMIAKSKDKKSTFQHIMWHIPAGLVNTKDPKRVEIIAAFIDEVAIELGVDKNEIFNEDGLITDIEKIGGGSKIEVEVEPTVEPTVKPEPTEETEPEPTEETTEEPEEESEGEEKDETEE